MTSERTTVRGLHPPLPTPMRDGAIDLDSLQRALEHLEPHVHGLLYGGSISETTSLSIDERIEVVGRIAATIGGDRLSVSIADNSLTNTRAIIDAAQAAGVRTLVLSCPNYYTNDVAMLVEYFSAVTELIAPDSALCLYDNPYTSHTWLSAADIVTIADAVPALTHVKVTDQAIDKVGQIVAASDLTVLSGDDAVLWHHLQTGAAGIMTALPLIFPERCATLWQAFLDGDTVRARGLFYEMLAYGHTALEAADYPYFVKATMHRQGVLASDEVRPPLRRITSHRLDDALDLV